MKSNHLSIDEVLLRCICVALLLTGFVLPLEGQSRGPWQGKKCAVVLTYDDALNVHLDKVIPLLDSAGLKGTFYISGSFPGFCDRLDDWKAAARSGHELGNHTLFHPCDGTAPQREWVEADYDLSTYTLKRMIDEVAATNTLLKAVDGMNQRTFAYPCGDMLAGGQSYVQHIRDNFVGARGVTMTSQRKDAIDPYNVGCFMANGQPGDQLVSQVKQAMADHALLVFLFHGVGGEHAINEPAADHHSLVAFLKQQEGDIWIATMRDVCAYVRNAH
jgi:peptidoglycan/xylan/chitin deacetylase (PgdA/CDA1 family)